MRSGRFLFPVFILATLAACQWGAPVLTEPMPVFPTFGSMPTEWLEPTTEPWSPQPTATVPIPTSTPSPLPLPPVEGYYQQFNEEVAPLVARLASAPPAPSDYALPSAADRQIHFVPQDARLYYAQALLFPDLLIGSSTASQVLYVTYSYARSGCLGLWGMSCDTEGMDALVRLYAETQAGAVLVEEMPGYYSGSGAPSRSAITSHSIVPLTSLGEQAAQVEATLEIIIGTAVGADLGSSYAPYANPAPQVIIAICRQALSSAFKSDREDAADLLSEYGPAAAEAVPDLILALQDIERDVRRSAASALGSIGPAAAEAIPLLIAMLDDETFSHEYEHPAFIWSIGRIGPLEAILPTLVEALGDPFASVRETAVEALGSYGAAAAPALDGLLPLLTDEDEDVRKAVANAMAAMGPAASAAVPALVAALETEAEETVQFRLVKALGSIGPSAAPAVPVLISIVEGGGNYTDNAIEALGNIGPAAAAAVPAILPYLLDPYDIYAAVEALGKIGPDAIQAVPALIDALRNQDFWAVHDKLAGALVAITGQNFGEDPDAWQAWWEANKP